MYLAIDLKNFILCLQFLNEAYNSTAHIAQIYLIANALEGRQVFLFPQTLT
jgi:hypothetical protein